MYTITCTATGYVNTHDGYCSGGECELQPVKEQISFEAMLTEEEIRLILSGEQGVDEIQARKILGKHLRAHEARTYDSYGSGFCTNDPESEHLGIYQHDFDVKYSEFSVRRSKQTNK